MDKSLTHISSELAEANMPGRIKEALEKLEGNGAVSFPYIQELVTKDFDRLSPDLKERIRGGIFYKIQYTMMGGHWGDLDGVEPLLEKFEIDSMTFSSELTETLESLYNRFSPGLLNNMHPAGLWHEDGNYNLHTIPSQEYKDKYGRIYHKIPYAKDKLMQKGFTEEELTDEYLNTVFRLTEILMMMYHNKQKTSQIMESVKVGIRGLIELSKDK